MIKKILLPLDGSDYNKVSFEYAKEFAKIYEAEISLLHVIDIKNLEGPFFQDLSASIGAAPYINYQDKIKDILLEKGKSILSEYSQLCEKELIKYSTSIQTGIIANEIADAGVLCDLIIMGNRGENAHLGNRLFGSTFESVVKLAESPLLITEMKFVFFDKIVVALSDNKYAYKSLQFAVNFAQELNLELHILVVENNDDEYDLIAGKANEYLGSQHFENFKFNKRSGGKVSAEIVNFSKEVEAGMIVMGAYGHNRLYELILGSTTEDVFRNSQIPVFLIR